MSATLMTSLYFAFGCLALAMAITVVRLFKGPGAQDRILALDYLYINGLLMMLLLGLRHHSSMYFEAALLIAMLGFVTSLAMGKFLLRGEVIE